MVLQLSDGGTHTHDPSEMSTELDRKAGFIKRPNNIMYSGVSMDNLEGENHLQPDGGCAFCGTEEGRTAMHLMLMVFGA